MIGAIIGDVVGSIYERINIKTTDFPLFNERSRFTDDTVLTIAVADSILNDVEFGKSLKRWARKYPKAGYGYRFKNWFHSDSTEPYNSWGNGSAMRVSPAGFAFDTLDDALKAAKKSAEVTHNHPEGIKGAQATAAAIYMSRKNASKEEIKQYVEETFNYNLSRTADEIRPNYRFDVSCQGSVPEAIIAFLESSDFENAVRLAISLGGDSDTIACITGGISQAFYKTIDPELVKFVRAKLPPEMIEIIDQFEAAYLAN
jgi:ADP-ribosylglycohydrolase